MRFGPWFPIEFASRNAPRSEGLLEVRAEQVLVYPRGKSAMVAYAMASSGQTLAERVGELVDALEHSGGRYVRFAAMTDPSAAHARRLRDFVERMGAPPVAQHLIGDSRRG